MFTVRVKLNSFNYHNVHLFPLKQKEPPSNIQVSFGGNVSSLFIKANACARVLKQFRHAPTAKLVLFS